jgi:hypothetical protein
MRRLALLRFVNSDRTTRRMFDNAPFGALVLSLVPTRRTIAYQISHHILLNILLFKYSALSKVRREYQM